eukprot:TRINITY_DN4660_c0_g1_i1.p1 TRINITY_DN4660_c0_g1~~TRINITY_DN4660_c0_g1_i1.p1  ORF type:complete len:551 (+),score=131.54 TRINITY_DN4660_c0_g1_i1:212-1654(+)
MTNFFVNTPICCPSRTEFFTGRYFHNLRGEDGKGCMHANTSAVANPAQGLFGRLTRLGYSTGLFGKVTNNQLYQLQSLVSNRSATYISCPIHYADYYADSYFNYNASRGDVEGTIETINATDPIYGTAYQTSQLGNRSIAWLDSLVATDELPFFMYIGPHAPHVPATPAPWYQDRFSDLKAPRTPNYNVESPDKAAHIRQNPPMTEQLQCWEDQHFRDRWRTLLSVDDLVEGLCERLEHHGLLDSTYVIYSSDHGFKLGQWRVPTAKEHPYETDIHVPLFISGPGIKEGVQLPDIAGNVDFLPTILKLAGEDVPLDETDGREFASLLLGVATEPRRTAWLNEYESNGDRFSDDNSVWVPANATDDFCGGPLPTGPSGIVNHSLCVESDTVGGGNCYFFDSLTSNNWRALRRINSTHNTQYIEVSSSWAWDTLPPVHYEYYDVTNDPYQVKNLYAQLSQSTRDALAAELEAYYQCKGTTCP